MTTTTRVLRTGPEEFARVTRTNTGWTLHAKVVTADAERTIQVHRATADFTDADIDEVIALARRSVRAVGERRTVRRFHLHGPWWLYTHVNTGPPTWRLPRAKVERYGLMVGWIRGLIAISVRRER